MVNIFSTIVSFSKCCIFMFWGHPLTINVGSAGATLDSLGMINRGTAANNG